MLYCWNPWHQKLATAIYKSQCPIYSLSGSGKIPRMKWALHLGTTTRCPRPRIPWTAQTYAWYIFFREMFGWKFWSNVPARVSSMSQNWSMWHGSDSQWSQYVGMLIFFFLYDEWGRGKRWLCRQWRVTKICVLWYREGLGKYNSLEIQKNKWIANEGWRQRDNGLSVVMLVMIGRDCFGVDCKDWM